MKCGPGLDAGTLGRGMDTGMPYGYSYRDYGYGYPGGAMPKEEEIAMLEEQERWLTSELDGVRKRLEEVRK